MLKKNLFYTNYVDEIFILMENNHDLDSFYNKMNTIHPNLKFTIEKPNDNKLPFLDTEIKKD